MKATVIALTTALVAIALPHATFAEDAKPAMTAAAAVSTGEIRKSDKDAGKLTIKHGELKNLSMPAMTMVFEVADKAVLARLKTGDRITFVANSVNGQLTASDVTPAQ